MYDSYVDQAAALIGLNIPEQYRQGVIENIERLHTAAALLPTSIPDNVTAAPVFEP